MDPKKPQRPGEGYPVQNSSYQRLNHRELRKMYSGNPEMQCPPTAPPNRSNSQGYYHGSHSSRNYDNRGHSSNDRGYSAPRNSYVPRGTQRAKGYRQQRESGPDGEAHSKGRSEAQRDGSHHSDNEQVRSGRSSRSSGRESRQSEVQPSSTNDSWSEHLSSSGKTYYYNCSNNTSQWDRPREMHSKGSSRGYVERPSSDSRSRRGNNRYSRGNNRQEGNNWNNNNWENNSFNDNRGEMYSKKYSNPSRSYEAARSEGAQRDCYNRGYQRPQPPPSPQMPPRAAVPSTSYSRPRPDFQATVQRTTTDELAAALPQMLSTSLRTSDPRAAIQNRPGSSGASARSEFIDLKVPSLQFDNALPRKMDGDSRSAYACPKPTILSPSLTKYYRKHLTSHVADLSTNLLEQQADRYAQEYQKACLQITQVSAELKCSRSLVRQQEIQATLQDQKLMYLRQQITQLEGLKNLNTFMPDA